MFLPLVAPSTVRKLLAESTTSVLSTFPEPSLSSPVSAITTFRLPPTMPLSPASTELGVLLEPSDVLPVSPPAIVTGRIVDGVDAAGLAVHGQLTMLSSMDPIVTAAVTPMGTMPPRMTSALAPVLVSLFGLEDGLAAAQVALELDSETGGQAANFLKLVFAAGTFTCLYYINIFVVHIFISFVAI